MQRLNIEQVAERLCVSTRQVRKLIASGQLRGINVSLDPNGKHKKYAIDLEDLERFEESRRSQPPERKKPRRKKQQDFPVYTTV
jgi:transposase